MNYGIKILKTIKQTKRRLFKLITKLSGKKELFGEFATRIKARGKIFWESPDSDYVINTIMQKSDPPEKWKDVENWQRKLHNKYNSREFARKYDCKVPELYWKGKDFHTLNFENLPHQYVIRPTILHSSRGVFLMNNSINLMDGKSYSKEEIKEALATTLDQNLKIEFLVEEFLRTESGEYRIHDDYKFYMFDGKIASIQVINRVSAKGGCNTWYDENWNQMKNITSNYSVGKVQKPPRCLPEMKEYARRLSKAYEIFARIDFYATDKGVYFGEFTPTPASGKGFTPAGDKFLADYWDRYCKGKI